MDIDHPHNSTVTNTNGDYADPMTASGFKRLFSPTVHENKEIIQSFLNTFLSDFSSDSAMNVEEVCIPISKAERDKRERELPFVDMEVTSQSGARYIVEIEANRDIISNKRTLCYAFSAIARQPSIAHVLPVIEIQIFGHHSNRTPENDQYEDKPHQTNQLINEYAFTNAANGQILKGLQIIQIDLTHARKDLFLPQKDFSIRDWWLSVLKFAPQYTNAIIQNLKQQGIVMPDVISKVFDQLFLPKS